MPRKPKQETIKTVMVINGKPISVSFYPPKPPRRSWFAYWPGLVAAKSTGQRTADEAREAVVGMLQNNGRLAATEDLILTDDEFEEIQRAHFARKLEPAAQQRAAKSLAETLDAISAFRLITGLEPITVATADDCASFQRTALEKPKNWRSQYPKSKENQQNLSPNTVVKWSRSLQAAVERACRNGGKKCVRGVVDERKLLTSNPWTQFTWIEGKPRPIRQFDTAELLSLVDYLETRWALVPAAAAAAKVFLWSCCRKSEVAGLTWNAVRFIGDKDRPIEIHFQMVGKWGVERWFRLPPAVYRELVELRTPSDFVFAAYTEQIRLCHADNPGCLRKIKSQYDPKNFGRWLYEQIQDWSATHPKGRAYLHHFRKTALQHALEGEDVNRQVAADARVGEGVMMASYTMLTDRKLRAMSNRTYRRILLSLQPEVARRYGYVEGEGQLEEQVLAAVASADWKRVTELSARLAKQSKA